MRSFKTRAYLLRCLPSSFVLFLFFSFSLPSSHSLLEYVMEIRALLDSFLALFSSSVSRKSLFLIPKLSFFFLFNLQLLWVTETSAGLDSFTPSSILCSVFCLGCQCLSGVGHLINVFLLSDLFPQTFSCTGVEWVIIFPPFSLCFPDRLVMSPGATVQQRVTVSAEAKLDSPPH